MIFYLGTHMPHWLGQVEIPLCVSRRVLARRASFPRARGPWIEDSGGFTELSMRGRWTVGAERFAEEVRCHRESIGMMQYAAPQDWMCEPWIVSGTGLSVEEHIRRTVGNLVQLRSLAPEVPWMPVLQGWRLEDYVWCVRAYRAVGIDLTREPLVGLGSVCRRQGTAEAEWIVRRLAWEGMRLHGFGFKITGLRRVSGLLTSADSMAWSFRGRRSAPLPGHGHKSCANCLEFALRWRARVVDGGSGGMFDCGAIA